MSEGALERLMRTRPVAVTGALYLIGSAVGMALDVISPLALIIAAAVSLTGVIALRVFLKKTYVAIFCVAVLLFSAGRSAQVFSSKPDIETTYHAEIAATVAEEPYLKGERVVCKLKDLTVNGKKVDYCVRLYLRGDGAEDAMPEYGDKIAFTGHIFAGSEATNPGEFDFSAYLWKHGMAGYVTCQVEDFSIAEKGNGSLLRSVYRLRRAVGQSIDEHYSEENAPLARALIIGDKTVLSDDVRENFADVGIAHVLAVSGMHISVTSGIIMLILGLFLPKRIAYAISVIVTAFYALLTGFQPSVVRALVMFALSAAGHIAGERYDMLTGLGLASVLQLAIDPMLAGDTGFLLSFTACYGIALLYRSCTRLLGADRIHAIRSRRLRSALDKVNGTLSLTLSCEAMTLPIIASAYGELPVLAIAGNLVLVPLALAAYTVSLIAVLIPFVSIGADILLTILRKGVETLASVPVSAIALPSFPAYAVLAFFAGTFLLSDLVKKNKMVVITASLLCLLSLVPGILSDNKKTEGLEVVCLDAGQANAALVRTDTCTAVIDCGDTDTPIGDYLSDGAIRPEAVFLTHPDRDHAGGLSALLEVATPDVIYIPYGWYDIEDTTESVKGGIEAAAEEGIPIIEIGKGSVISLSQDVTVNVLGPEEGMEGASENEISLVLQVTHGASSIVFMGDVPISCEPEELPDTDVVMIAHHGSSSSTSMWSLLRMTPSVALISVGTNGYGHPSEEVLDRLDQLSIPYLRTDESGALTVTLAYEGGIHVETYK